MLLPPAATYAILAVLVGVVVAGFFADRIPKTSRFAALRPFSIVVQLTALVAAYFLLRPGRGDTRERIAKSTNAGHAVMLDFYSNT